MNIQEIREALSGFRERFGLSTFAELNVADLADLLVRLNEMEKVIIHRIEVSLDERGYQTTPVFVEPGVTVTEVGLGESIRPEDEIEGDDDFTEEFLYEFRKHVPKDWDIRIADGRLEVREWAERPEPLFHFDVTRHDSFELVVGIPEIVGAMMTQMHRDFCGLREFTEEAVAGCTAPGELAAAVVAKAKSMPISWELSKRIEDAFPGVIVKKPARQAPHPGLRCLQCGFGIPLGEMTDHQKNCTGDKSLRLCPLCNGTGKERFEAVGTRSPQHIPCSRCSGAGTVPEKDGK